MEYKLKRVPVMVLAALVSVAACFLRRHQLATAFDAAGLPIPGSGGLLTWFSVLMVVLFAVYAFFLRRRKTYKAANESGGVAFGLSLLAGALTAVGGVWALLSGVRGMALVQAVGIVLVAVCWIFTALQRSNGTRVSAWLYLIPALYFTLELLVKFRGWGNDPVVLDYAYELMALIGAMCGLFQLAGFCFDRGHRRTAVFFCLFGVFFGAASMADVSGADILIKLGTVLWLEAALWQLLRPGKQRT